MLRLMLLSCLAPLAIWCSTSSATAYLGKGNELMGAERYDEAAAQFKQTLQRDETLNEACENLAAQRSIADWRYFLGVAFLKKSQFADAIECFKLQLKTNPRDFRAHQ